ncbi:DUF2480 family protein [Sediminibacterium sp.]|uniref:DUF2480 family protein n=1 Tax=Sediminibacterium sp. TaxID=1917865 RepID=UPI0027353049|nr:DUF2480 family protein [Sediminibacterium sp.]MDP3394630.1 DUF2480 family protein [Sediminibacterium sp.]MDP3568465.1 DUF2480 family protein [Sediminibacterium sp.]
MEPIVNKVAESGIISLDLEAFFPKEKIMVFDLKDYLFMELILKEKDFRAALLTTDWEKYRDSYVALTCSADAIIPMWANMLVTVYLTPLVKGVYFGTEAYVKEQLLLSALDLIQGVDYTDQRIVVKGCGEDPVPASAYVKITSILKPFAKSIMYGEPCSTVPLYKKK